MLNVVPSLTMSKIFLLITGAWPITRMFAGLAARTKPFTSWYCSMTPEYAEPAVSFMVTARVQRLDRLRPVIVELDKLCLRRRLQWPGSLRRLSCGLMANGTAASQGHRSCKQNHPNEAPIRELEPRYEHKQCNLTAASRGVNEAR